MTKRLLPVGVYGIEDRLHHAGLRRLRLAGQENQFGRLIRQFAIGHHGRRRAADTDQISLVEPALRHALDLPEQVHLRRLAGIAELVVEQVLGEVIADLARPHRLQHRRRQFHALADDAFQQHAARADLFRRQDQPGIVGEVRRRSVHRAVRRDNPPPEGR